MCRGCLALIHGQYPRRVCCVPCITMRRRKSRAMARRFCIRAAYCQCVSIKFPCIFMRPRHPGLRVRSCRLRWLTVRRRSKRLRSKRALRWCRWRVRACGIRWVFSPMHFRFLNSRVSRLTWCRHLRPTSRCPWTLPLIRWIRTRWHGLKWHWQSCVESNY